MHHKVASSLVNNKRRALKKLQSLSRQAVKFQYCSESQAQPLMKTSIVMRTQSQRRTFE